MNELKNYIAIILGILVAIIVINKIQFFIFLFIFLLVTFILGFYVTQKYDIPVGDFMGYPFKFEKRFKKSILGRICILFYLICIGIVVGFTIVYIFQTIR